MAKRSTKSCLVDREVRCVTEGVKIGLAGNRMTVLISKTGLPQVDRTLHITTVSSSKSLSVLSFLCCGSTFSDQK